MIASRRVGRLMFTLVTMIALGCSGSKDERMVELSERSLQRQREQNEMIARQSQAVIRENQRVAEAARELVAKDAEARKELVQAQRELQTEIQEERSSLDRQREELEQERRDIAQRRGRDPILAEAIKSIGTLLVCLVPLLVAAFALSRLERGQPDNEALSELLVRELTTENPVLLPPGRVAALEDRTGHASDDPGDPMSDDEPDPRELPF